MQERLKTIGKINNFGDLEREFLTDSIYLQEAQQLLYEETMRELNRLPAEIVVIDKDKILEKDEHQNFTLPF